MSKVIATPCCGIMVDLDAMPPTSKITGSPGKYCPGCKEPLDEIALDHTHGKHFSNTDPYRDHKMARRQAAERNVAAAQRKKPAKDGK